MTLAEAARAVLQERGEPAHVDKIWSEISVRKLFDSSGKTPEATLATELLRRTLGVRLTRRGNSERVFYRSAPNTFGLVDWLDDASRAKLEAEEVSQLQAATAGSAVAKVDFDVAAFLADTDEKRVEERRRFAAEARELVQQKLGSLEEDDLRQLFTLLNSDWYGGKARRDRFGLAFTGDLANKIVAQLDEANEAIRQLWEADGDEQTYAALDRFYEAKITGAGRSLPTAILHVREPARYFPLMKRVAQGYMNLTGRPNPRGGSSAKYREYVEGVRELVAEHSIPPELVDALLAAAAHTPTAAAERNKEAARYEFTGFGPDAFAFLAELREHNTETWFHDNKSRFRAALDRPLRALVRDLGQHHVGPLNPEIETTANSHRTISKLRKNIYGKREEDCYHTYYWAAFYRTGRTKSSDAQLYVNVFGDRLECGFYIGTRAEDVRAYFANAVRANAGVVEEILAELAETGEISVREEAEDRATRGERLRVASAQELADAFENKDSRICKIFEPSDPVGSPDLVDAVWAVFERVYPFFLLATSESPGPAIEAYRGGQEEAEPDPDDEPEDVGYQRYELLRDTFLAENELRDIEALIGDKSQIVLYGPPGTGKTFVGERIGRYLAGAKGHVKVVQFHPSYGYEDFVEGIRPGLGTGGALEFDVHDGIFKRFCDAARQRPGARFVLVIDEINRGNLPRIFGELLYLLENRGSRVDLPYSKKPFSVPENVLLIGTMNSADHSIALVDFALRRRFHFVYFAPRADVLRRWLAANRPDMEFVAKALDRLNERLLESGVERELLVGHSHFMRPHLDEAGLRLLWDHTVVPLLEEYFYGRPQAVEAFSYDAFFEAEVDVEDMEEGEGTDDGVEPGA